MSTPFQATQFAPRSPEQKRKPGQTLYKRAWPSATLNNTGGERFAPAPCIIESFIQCLTGFSSVFGRTGCELRGLVRCAHVGARFSTKKKLANFRPKNPKWLFVCYNSGLKESQKLILAPFESPRCPDPNTRPLGPPNEQKVDF